MVWLPGAIGLATKLNELWKEPRDGVETSLLVFSLSATCLAARAMVEQSHPTIVIEFHFPSPASRRSPWGYQE